jgi:hypothetical protein
MSLDHLIQDAIFVFLGGFYCLFHCSQSNKVTYSSKFQFILFFLLVCGMHKLSKHSLYPHCVRVPHRGLEMQMDNGLSEKISRLTNASGFEIRHVF